jgi:class 3 adenylate cyclase
MTTRRLAAILAADMVGYSRLMGANEATMLPDGIHVMRSCRDRSCASSATAAARSAC